MINSGVFPHNTPWFLSVTFVIHHVLTKWWTSLRPCLWAIEAACCVDLYYIKNQHSLKPAWKMAEEAKGKKKKIKNAIYAAAKKIGLLPHKIFTEWARSVNDCSVRNLQTVNYARPKNLHLSGRISEIPSRVFRHQAGVSVDNRSNSVIHLLATLQRVWIETRSGPHAFFMCVIPLGGGSPCNDLPWPHRALQSTCGPNSSTRHTLKLHQLNMVDKDRQSSPSFAGAAAAGGIKASEVKLCRDDYDSFAFFSSSGIVNKPQSKNLICGSLEW